MTEKNRCADMKG